jgi:hypothetical protein
MKYRIVTIFLLALLSEATGWTQGAALSGTVKELGNCDGKQPATLSLVAIKPCAIQDVRIIIDGHLKAITGKKGTYEVSGLALGKIHVRYAKAGYGSTEAEVEIKPPKTEHDVSLFKDSLDALYWAPISNQLKSGTTQFTALTAWQSITVSDLSPQAKATGAKAIGTSFATAGAPDSLRQYESVTTEQITTAEKWFDSQMTGDTAEAGRAPLLPTPILIDVAAHVVRRDPTKSHMVLADFSAAYGTTAGQALEKKINVDTLPEGMTVPQTRKAK